MIYPKPRTEFELSHIRERFVYVGGKNPIQTVDGKIPPIRSNKKGGYLYIDYQESGIRFLFAVSHVVWFLNTGTWPTLQIDHKDTDVTNNDFENLRELTKDANNARRKSWAYPNGMA